MSKLIRKPFEHFGHTSTGYLVCFVRQAERAKNARQQAKIDRLEGNFDRAEKSVEFARICAKSARAWYRAFRDERSIEAI